MKIGDLVYKTPSPQGRGGFTGIIVGLLGAVGYFDIMTTEGNVEFAHAVTLELISESR